MNWIFEATLRTVVLAATAGFGLALFRVRSSTMKLAVWRLVLFSSLLMPFASLLKPVVEPPAPVAHAWTRVTTRLAAIPAPVQAVPAVNAPVDWQGLAIRSYALIAGLLLLRALLGLLRLRHLGAESTPLADLGPEWFETSRLAVPITYGVFRPRILLPSDWRTWDDQTLAAVLAHEGAHIAQGDFLTQVLSKVNRAVYWANPFAWWLDRQLARLAEDASDDAALHRVNERPAYAAMLLGFASRRTNLAVPGVAMARHANVSKRIERILDEARSLGRPLTIWKSAALTVAACALVLTIAACRMTTVSAAQTNKPSPTPAPGKAPAAQTRTEPATRWWWSDRDRSEWVLVTPQGTSMSGDRNAAARARSLGNRAHGDYLWFTRNGTEYMIDDPSALRQIEDWIKPVEELGRQQGELGEKQGALGEQMGKIGEEMGRLGEQMGSVKVEMPDLTEQLREIEKLKTDLALKAGSYQLKSGDMVEQVQKLATEAQRIKQQVSLDQLADLQGKLGELQAKLGEAQALAGDKQAHIGDIQARLGEKQAVLGEQQAKLGEQQAELGEKQAKASEEAGKKLERLFEESVKDGRAKPVK